MPFLVDIIARSSDKRNVEVRLAFDISVFSAALLQDWTGIGFNVLSFVDNPLISLQMKPLELVWFLSLGA